MSRWRGCRRVGCWGCGGAALVLVAAAIGLGAMVVERMREPADRRVEQHEHPAPEGAGRVAIELSHGRFRIEPVAAGRPLRLEVDYDAAAFALEESFEPAGGAGDGWLWTVRFGPRRGWFAALGHEARNTVRVELPRDLAFRLTGGVDTGRSELELGGLDLRSIDLRTRTGEHAILFSEPLAGPAEEVRIVGNAGSLSIDRLGHASPAETVVEHRLGGLALDLRGAWRADARVTVRQQLGEARIQAPAAGEARLAIEGIEVSFGERDVAAELLEEREGAGAPEGPTVSFDVRVGFGDLRLRR